MSTKSTSSYNPMEAAWQFGRLMPGFQFFDPWNPNAWKELPAALGQWVSPILDPDELEKRLKDLRAVQFWLEQHARMVGMTIQALEVQVMTLKTLKSMNVPVDALRQALKTSAPTAAANFPFNAFQPKDAGGKQPTATDAATDAPVNPMDPMQWWGKLTQQFTELTQHTLQEVLKQEAPADNNEANPPPTTAKSTRKKIDPFAKADSASAKTAPEPTKETSPLSTPSSKKTNFRRTT